MIPIKELAKLGIKFCEQHSADILTGVACVGIAVTGILSFRAGVKTCEDLIDESYSPEDISPKRKAQIIIKHSLPAIATGALACGASIGSNIINKNNIDALTASYTLAVEGAKVYKEKVKESIGEKKEEIIKSEIAKDELAKEWDKQGCIKQTHGGTYVSKDMITGQYFRSDAETLRKALDDLNSYFMTDDEVSVEEYCSALGLEEVCSPIRQLVWPSAMRIKPDIISTMCPNGEPGYYIYFDEDKLPMEYQEAMNYNQNHYVSSTYL